VQQSLDDVASKSNALIDLVATEESRRSALDIMSDCSSNSGGDGSRGSSPNERVGTGSEFYTSTPRGSSLSESHGVAEEKANETEEEEEDEEEYSSDDGGDDEESDHENEEEENASADYRPFITYEQKYDVGGSSANETDELFAACYAKNLMKVKQLLEDWKKRSGGKPTTLAVDNQGNTLLHVAAFSNWIQGIHTCLSNNIDIDAKNIEGNTALHLARENGNATAETLLIALGANEQVKNIYGLTYQQGARF
jgi:ankyrin repeat protein